METWQRLDQASPTEVRALLFTCCGSERWIDALVVCRPFGSNDRLLAAARETWWALTPSDWQEAFSHHPKIGDRRQGQSTFASTRHLSAKEQAGVTGAAGRILAALDEANRAYERRFGYIFIVCATGRSAAEMLQMLRERLGNDPETEIQIAAEEQARITAIRLKALG
jgi:2-oxo-4-hydroxy-4-carboxy-5-ureidoimidazoline decarboxylase